MPRIKHVTINVPVLDMMHVQPTLTAYDRIVDCGTHDVDLEITVQPNFPPANLQRDIDVITETVNRVATDLQNAVTKEKK